MFKSEFWFLWVRFGINFVAFLDVVFDTRELSETLFQEVISQIFNEFYIIEIGSSHRMPMFS
jgi:hypothetical protein